MRPIYFIALATLFLVGCGATAGSGEPGHPLVYAGAGTDS